MGPLLRSLSQQVKLLLSDDQQYEANAMPLMSRWRAHAQPVGVNLARSCKMSWVPFSTSNMFKLKGQFNLKISRGQGQATHDMDNSHTYTEFTSDTSVPNTSHSYVHYASWESVCKTYSFSTALLWNSWIDDLLVYSRLSLSFITVIWLPFNS